MAKEYYAGADWIESNIKHGGKWIGPMSEFGREVADLLGDLFLGIYHVNPAYLIKVDWSGSAFIELAVDQTFATFDYSNLTRFVFLCHDYGIRGQISPRSNRTMMFMFHPRERKNGARNVSQWHPTLEESIEMHRKAYPPTVAAEVSE